VATINQKAMEQMAAHRRATAEASNIMSVVRERGDPVAARLERASRMRLCACADGHVGFAVPIRRPGGG
jgi:hypothetical protein